MKLVRLTVVYRPLRVRLSRRPLGSPVVRDCYKFSLEGGKMQAPSSHLGRERILNRHFLAIYDHSACLFEGFESGRFDLIRNEFEHEFS